MTSLVNKTYEFGPFRLDAAERVLLRDGQPVPLTLKAFDVLMLLVERSGHIIEKDELMNRVWAGSFVEEGNLKVTVSMLRKALEDNGNENRYIETVPRRGYRFTSAVKEIETIDIVLHERVRESLTINGVAQSSARRRSPFVVGGALLISLAIVVGFFLLRGRPDSNASLANSGTIKSIAILPFRPLVESDRDDSLALGLTDTLIMRLSSLHALKIPPLASIRKYSRLDQDPLGAGRELRVESVLDGSLQREGNRLRVTVRLIRVADGVTLWTEQFDEDFTELLALQDRVSERLAIALSMKLTDEQRQLLVEHHTENVQAYELYLKAHYSSRLRSKLNERLEYYDQAIKLDPGYALSYAGLAETYMRLSLQEFLPPSESFPKAGAAAAKALELDERLVAAHVTLAMYKFNYEWNSAEAERLFKRAIELDPNDSWAHSEYGSYLQLMGRLEEAINERKRAYELAPGVAAELSNLAYAYDLAGKYDEALTHFQTAIQMNPRFAWAHLGIARAYFHLGRMDEAIAEINTAMSLSDGNMNTIATLGVCYALAGKRNEARKLVVDLQERAKEKYVAPYLIAIIYAGLSDRDQTFAWLDRAYNERHFGMTRLRTDPVFDRVRSDPRFAALMRRVGLESN